MADRPLDRLHAAVLLSTWYRETTSKKTTLKSIIEEVAPWVTTSRGGPPAAIVEAVVAAALREGTLLRPERLPRQKDDYFLVTDGGVDRLIATLGPLVEPGKSKYPALLALSGQTLDAGVRERANDFGYFRAIVIARALGFEESIGIAKTESDLLNIIAAAIVGAKNVSPEAVRGVQVSKWIADDETTEHYSSVDAPRLEPMARPKPARKPKAEPKPTSAPKPKAEPKPRAASKPKSPAATSRKKTGVTASAARAQDRPSSLALPEFAEAVLDAADRAEGRIGRKVFINRAWAAFESGPHARSMRFERFTELLLEANKRNLLVLSRADLPESFAAEDVRQSRLKVLDGDVHFLQVRKER